MGFDKVATKDEIQNGYGKTIGVNGKTIAILNNDGEFYAIDDTCVHAGGPLGEGTCSDGLVTCPWHGWQYELKTGKCFFNPNVVLNTYEVKIDGDDILVNVT